MIVVWFKSDDAFWRHKKVRRLGKERAITTSIVACAGLWQLSGTWCADNLTDGYIPHEQVETWDPRRRLARRLVDVGLWEDVEHDSEPCYHFHDWPDYNPTRASIEADREEWRLKKQNQRNGKRSKPAMSPGDTQGDTTRDSPETPPENPHGSPTRFPDPVPVPVPEGGSLGGEARETYRAGDDPPAPKTPSTSGNRPPSTCREHEFVANPPPCRACAEQRKRAETWDREQRLITRRCPLCDADGWRWIDPSNIGRGPMSGPGARCDHTRTNREAS